LIFIPRRASDDPMIDFSLPEKVVAEHLEELFKRYGALKVIRRNDGPEFKSKYFQTLMAR